MKKVSIFITIAGVFFFAIIIFSFFGKLTRIPEPVALPPELCLSKKFPGKSILINSLDSKTRSAFDTDPVNGEAPIFPDESNKFYDVFQEERFEPAKFQDGKVFPEIAMADEIYRFFWLRSFHNPVVIRLYRIGDEKFIVVKQTDAQGSFNKGNLIFNEKRKLKDSEWCEFIKLLDDADFWNKTKINTAALANDGAFWDIEGIREQRYYISGEQSPQTGKFRDACIYLMRISGLNINENAPDFY